MPIQTPTDPPPTDPQRPLRSASEPGVSETDEAGSARPPEGTTVPATDPGIRAEAETRAARRAAARKRLAAPPPTTPLPARPRFSQPVRQILMMLVVLGLVGLGGSWAYGRIWDIFAASPWLNGVIGAVFVFGVLTCFWQVGQLVRSVSWIERFAARRRADQARADASATTAGLSEGAAPLLLAPLAALLGGHQGGGAISATAARSMLDSVATRIDEARDITRYLANLLIFLGLLGTFYGLATTVPAVVETIRALAPQEGESALAVFEKLMTGLEGQLGGMATAFSSSLLGLAGSLVVGLLELFVTHGQNRFYRELEEWMTSFTRIAIADDASDEKGMLAEFADRVASHFDNLTRFYTERDQIAELDQIAADERALMMARTVEDMARQLRTDGEARHELAQAQAQLSLRLVEGQKQLIAQTEPASAPPTELTQTLARLAAGQDQLIALAARDGGLATLVEGLERLIALAEIGAEDNASAIAEMSATGDEVRARLRSLDQRLARLADNNAEARLTMQAELRSDLALLTRAVRRLAVPGTFPSDRDAGHGDGHHSASHEGG